MPFLPEASFNPQVSKVPVLGASSGNPQSFQDPKNVASVGAKIQAMADQAQADTLYDEKKEGFRGGSAVALPDDPRIIALLVLGVGLIIGSYWK